MNFLSIIIFGVEIHLCADEIIPLMMAVSVGLSSGIIFIKYKWLQFKIGLSNRFAVVKRPITNFWKGIFYGMS